MAFNPLKYYLPVSDLIKKNNADIDTSIGTFVGDTIVFPISVLYEKVSKISDLLMKINDLDSLVQAMNDPEFISDNAIALDITEQEVLGILNNILNNIAKDYNITRYNSTYAEGIVYFQFNPPTQQRTYTINTTTRIRSIFNLWYVPTEIYSFIVNPDPNALEFSLNQYYVADLNAYAFPVKVRCEFPGVTGNISSGQIAFREFGTPTDFIFATNLNDISGGRELETNEELVNRIKAKWKGQNYGTKGGFINLLNEQGYTDTYISSQSDPHMLRSPGGGAIDIYIRDYRGVVVEKTFNLQVNTEYIIKNLSEMSQYLPIFNIDLISGPGDVSLIKDTSVLYKQSSRAFDKLTVTADGDYTIQFVYNEHIAKLQELFNDDNNHILGQDVMLRQALPFFIDIQCVVVLYPNVNVAYVEQLIRNNIIKYINSKKLGSQLSQSDIIAIIEATEGVNYVKTPFIKFRQINGTNVETLIIKPIEYFQLNSLEINIQL